MKNEGERTGMLGGMGMGMDAGSPRREGETQVQPIG